MASLRKRYQDRAETKEAPATPVVEAESPVAAVETTETPKLAEQPTESNPVEKAAEDALRKRLREMEDAERMTREAVTQQQQQPRAAPEPQTPAAPPASVQAWCEANPDYFRDPIKNAELQVAALKCARDGLTWDDDRYIGAVERYLGLAPAASGNGQTNRARMRDLPPTQQAPPVRRQPQPVQRQSAPVSAPPTRDVPSMTTGRSRPSPINLTVEEKDIARSLGLTDAQYIEGKERMNRLKAAGALQDGG